MKKRTIATASQKADIAVLLFQHCHRNDEGFATFTEGYDDYKIAEEAGCKDAVASVTYIRKAKYGNLAPEPKGNGLDMLRLTSLEDRVSRIENRIVRDWGGTFE